MLDTTSGHTIVSILTFGGVWLKTVQRFVIILYMMLSLRICMLNASIANITNTLSSMPVQRQNINSCPTSYHFLSIINFIKGNILNLTQIMGNMIASANSCMFIFHLPQLTVLEPLDQLNRTWLSAGTNKYPKFALSKPSYEQVDCKV